MKDQNSVEYVDDTYQDKWMRAQSLFIESVLKPDHALRGCAHNQKCFNELMEIREDVVEYVRTMKRSEFDG